MANKEKDLQILNTVGQTVIFTSPLSGYGNYMVRTGVIQKNNSFLHSVFTATSKEYFYMNSEHKLVFIKKFLNNFISSKDFKKDVENYSNYKKILIQTIKHIYNSKEKIDDKLAYTIDKQLNTNPVYEIFFEIIPKDDIYKILNINDDIINSENIFKGYKEIIIHEISNYLDSLEILNHVKDKTKVEFIKKNIKLILNSILEEVEKSCFKTYYNNLINNDTSKLCSLLSEKLKTDIYFIDSRTRLPFKYNMSQLFNNKNAIILLKIQDRYETIGLLIDDNNVLRQFLADHFLIKKIKMFLFEPNKISLKYPELLMCVNQPKLLNNKQNRIRNIIDDTENKSDEDYNQDYDDVNEDYDDDNGYED